MTDKAYLHGAREALALAESWERGANDFDDAWRAKSLAEAKKCRARAEWYLHHARMERERSAA